MSSADPFRQRTRQDLEKLEESALAPFAQRSRAAHRTRQFEEPEHPYRTAFQRDRDRIIHSRAFRRLKHKRQVFLTNASDHYRTRITHTLEVAQLSRTIARALGLNEDLVEAIALGHDLGHTPFGHLGEVVLDKIMTGKVTLRGQQKGNNFGGFKHNYQSIRVVDYLEKKYAFNGLNLTAPVREGILKHTRLKRGHYNYPDFNYQGLHFEQDWASNLEGQVVAICDEIAQRTHDLEDGIRAGLVPMDRVRELPIVKKVENQRNLTALAKTDGWLYLGLMIRGLINELVDDVIRHFFANLTKYATKHARLQAFDCEIVNFSAEMDPLQKQLNKFIYKEIIEFSRLNWEDEMGEKLLSRLFEAYFNYPGLLPEYVLEKYFLDKGVAYSKASIEAERQVLNLQQDDLFLRLICDHVAGMTDNFAIHEAERISRQDKIQVSDLHLDFALGTENSANQQPLQKSLI